MKYVFLRIYKNSMGHKDDKLTKVHINKHTIQTQIHTHIPTDLTDHVCFVEVQLVIRSV